MDEHAPPQPQRQRHDCGRSFNVDAFEKHAKICAKVFMSKKKTFDSKKARILGLAEQNGQDAVKIAREGLRNQRKDPPAGAQARQEGWWKLKMGRRKPRIPRSYARSTRGIESAEDWRPPLPPSIPSGPDPRLFPVPIAGGGLTLKQRIGTSLNVRISRRSPPGY